MRITTFLDDFVFCLSIDGSIDASNAIALDNAIREAFQEGHYLIRIDCGQIKYISSAGIGVFVSHYDNFLQKGGKFVFCNMSDAVYHVFQILGLHELMDIQQETNHGTKGLKDESKFNNGMPAGSTGGDQTILNPIVR